MTWEGGAAGFGADYLWELGWRKEQAAFYRNSGFRLVFLRVILQRKPAQVSWRESAAEAPVQHWLQPVTSSPRPQPSHPPGPGPGPPTRGPAKTNKPPASPSDAVEFGQQLRRPRAGEAVVEGAQRRSASGLGSCARSTGRERVPPLCP